MAQAVSRRPLTAEVRSRSQVGPRRICGGQSGTGTGFRPRVLRFSPLLGKTEKITFITGFHNMPQGCGAFVASAAEPFTLKKIHAIY